jgi:Gpi18-like mannosyltransferase
MAKTHSLKIGHILLIGLVLRLILVVISGWHPDLNNHIDWGIRFLALGPKKFYENIFWGVSWPNQPLGTMLLFASMAWLKNIIFGFILFLNNTFPFFPSFIIPIIESNLHVWMVKLPFILCDLGLAYLIYKIVQEFKPSVAKLAASLFLFNPVLIYNSTIWGQTDSLINLLAISGIYFIFKKKYFWGIFLFLSSFLFKLSLIIYLPIFGLLLFKKIKDWKKMIFPIVFFTVFIFCLAIPFAFGAKNPFQWLWYMYTNRVLVRQGSMLNGNAFNLWFLLFGLDFSKSEFTKFAGITYQLWSRLLLCIFLIPVCLKFIKSKLSLYSLFMALLLTAFGSFIFLTNMHERYLYPIFPLLTVLLFIPKSKFTLKSLIILSLLHLINLYNLWFYPLFSPLKELLIASNFIICRIFSFILILICISYLIKYLKSEKI